MVVSIPPDTQKITPAHFTGVAIAGRAVLIRTDWSDHWGTDQYFEGHPYVTKEAAEYLRAGGAVLVGIDSHNIDDIRGKSRPAHSILLGADIPIVEHMTRLGDLPESGFKFFAVPVKVKNMGTFPVRAFGLVKL